MSAEPEERDDDTARRGGGSRCATTGIGIPPEHVVKVFDVFTRAQQGAQLSGTGIGLATAKRVVERHGGTIGVESTPGEGSTFWFTLPGVAGRHRY